MPPTVCEQYLGRKIANLVDERIVLFTTVHISLVDRSSVEAHESRLSFSIRGTDSDGTRESTREA